MIIAQGELTSPSFMTRMYVGTSPPLKYIVKTKYAAILFLATNSFRESGYAQNIVITMFTSVPTTV